MILVDVCNITIMCLSSLILPLLEGWLVFTQILVTKGTIQYQGPWKLIWSKYLLSYISGYFLGAINKPQKYTYFSTQKLSLCLQQLFEKYDLVHSQPQGSRFQILGSSQYQTYSQFGEGNLGVSTIPKLKPLKAIHKNKTPYSCDIRYFTKSSIGWTSSV